MLHAVGQGYLGVKIRKGNKRVSEVLSKIVCDKSTREVLAQRMLLRTLEGGCSVPIAVKTMGTKT